ncbi:AraC family transcriptional regulator [Basfia succiniciproducens]
MAQAYYQLKYTEKNIINIAYDCGFNDSSYFSTCFKNEYSIAPRELRI